MLETISVDPLHLDPIAAYNAAKRYIILKLNLFYNPPTSMPRLIEDTYLRGINMGRLEEAREQLYELGQENVLACIEQEILLRFKPLRIK